MAVSLQLLGLPFEHRALSVFRDFEQFQRINPLVKAPTLICDDGTVLMDSTLILEFAECLAAPTKSLMPADIAERQQALRVIGLGLAACEKSVQIIYERELRPAEKQHQPWLERVSGQLLAAFAALEAELRRRPPTADRIDQAGITTAVAWQFSRAMTAELLDDARFPTLQQFSEQAERLPAFAAAPHGLGTYPVVC